MQWVRHGSHDADTALTLLCLQVELPKMSCDQENKFESVLRSLGARDTTINFLSNQSVK
jgi:hypothetical protein